MSMPNLPPRKWDIDSLVYYLFGNPVDTKDLGLIGRIEQRIDGLNRLLITMVILLFTAVVTLAANLIVSVTHHP